MIAAELFKSFWTSSTALRNSLSCFPLLLLLDLWWSSTSSLDTDECDDDDDELWYWVSPKGFFLGLSFSSDAEEFSCWSSSLDKRFVTSTLII